METLREITQEFLTEAKGKTALTDTTKKIIESTLENMLPGLFKKVSKDMKSEVMSIGIPDKALMELIKDHIVASGKKIKY